MLCVCQRSEVAPIHIAHFSFPRTLSGAAQLLCEDDKAEILISTGEDNLPDILKPIAYAELKLKKSSLSCIYCQTQWLP